MAAHAEKDRAGALAAPVTASVLTVIKPHEVVNSVIGCSQLRFHRAWRIRQVVLELMRGHTAEH